jgi:D-amino-acid dehydrogenase
MHMKIAIIGAGIIGVTTAYELAADGHEVQVFERRASACEEASFANAGVVAPGYVSPWAAPGMPSKILQCLFKKHAPIRLKLPFQRDELAWIRQWLQACKPDAYQIHRRRLQQLAAYSAVRLDSLTKSLQLEYDSATGYMVLLRSELELAQIQLSLSVLKDADFAYKVLDGAAARKIEPALSLDTALHAAVHLPTDKVANCRQFALLLKDKAVLLGAKFHFGCSVSRAEQASQGIRLTSQAGKGSQATLTEPATEYEQTNTFDHIVVCAGVDSSLLLKPLNIHVPLIPVYGYAISAALREPMDAPVSGIMDERYKVAISRIGNRVRVAGSAEIGGHPTKINKAAIQTLYKVLSDWFPAAADTKRQVQIWKGARPMLPDGPPRIEHLGASGHKNIWLNLGHGSSGWALACGSARLLADKISERQPALHF